MSKLNVASAALKSAADRFRGRDVVRFSQELWLLPMQVRLSKDQMYDYLDSLGEPLPYCQGRQVEAYKMFGGCASSNYDDRAVFPVKTGSAAVTKVNVFLKDAACDFSKRWGLAVTCEALMRIYLRRLSTVTGRPTTNDEACAWLMWIHICLLREAPWKNIVALSYAALKNVSNTVKGIGVVCNHWGGLYVELGALAGRAVGAVDVEDEMDKRCNAETREGMLAKFPDDVLRATVKKIVSEERGPFKVPSYAAYFSERYATTKAGSHHQAGWEKSDRLPKRQLTRRNYVESMDADSIWRVAPGGYVSFSEKLEPGKTRAIYSLDSDNYMRFDAPARALERCWAGRRANLQPSRGMVGEDLERRGKDLRRWRMMFDYADFNSAHTIRAQQIVVEECFSGLDAEWLSWLSASFSNTWLRHPKTGEHVRSNGTLMSGHRMTSIINTVLNAAYIRLTVGEADYNQLHIEHVGDDIVCSTDDDALATRTVECLLASQLNMQRDKQGFGELCAEFLRISYDGTMGTGYVPRTISTLVCGNWVTEYKLDPAKYADSIQQGAWTLRNRGMHREAALLLTSTLVRRLHIQPGVAAAVSEGRVSVNYAPVWRAHGTEAAIETLVMAGRSGRATKRIPRWVDGVKLPHKAADELLRCSREAKDFRHVGVEMSLLQEALFEASYSNFRDEDDPGPPNYCHVSSAMVATYYRKPGSRLRIRNDDDLGMIGRLLKGRITERQWQAYGDHTGRDVSQALIGSASKLIAAGFGTPYQDAATCVSALQNGVFYTGMHAYFV